MGEIRDRLTKTREVHSASTPATVVAVGPTPRKPRHQGAFCLSCSRGALFSYDWPGRDAAVKWAEAHVCPAVEEIAHITEEPWVDPDPPF